MIVKLCHNFNFISLPVKILLIKNDLLNCNNDNKLIFPLPHTNCNSNERSLLSDEEKELSASKYLKDQIHEVFNGCWNNSYCHIVAEINAEYIKSLFKHIKHSAQYAKLMG